MNDRITLIMAQAVQKGICDMDEAMGIIAAVYTARVESGSDDFREEYGSRGQMAIDNLCETASPRRRK